MSDQNIHIAVYKERMMIVGHINDNVVIKLIKDDGAWIVNRMESIEGYDAPSAFALLRVYNQVFAKAINIDPEYFRQYNIDISSSFFMPRAS